MRKLLNWLDKYLLEIGIAFLLIFIPLYPKLPLVDIWQTWVYIRMEDLAVALVVAIWMIQLARRKVSLKTPLTIPVFVYWLVGGLSAAHASFILASQIAHFFPHLVLLHFLRRFEYMVLLFVIAATVKDLRTIKRYLAVIALTFLGVCIYGFGQKFLHWPAFLTMNEEFAKGIPFYLTPQSRLASTFGGHYDLAAYLVLMIALWASLFFGFKNFFLKIAIFLLTFAGFILLLFTASRISFAVYLAAISYVFFLQKKKWLIIPVILLSIFLAGKVTGSSQRFGKTFRVTRVVYDTRTGKPIATLEEFLAMTPTPTPKATPTPTPVVVAKVIKPPPPVTKAPVPSPEPEESLPLGSAFLSLEGLTKEEVRAQIIRKPIFTSSLELATVSAQMATKSGEFLIKRALVYDISFTTRFQGEWPRAMEAFKRNIFLGSGFSTISLATDNDYLRALGETGILGLVSFLAVLASFGLLVRFALKKTTKPLARSVLIGVLAGVFGLMLNAVLIDVFEASKVAFTLWLLVGLAVGLAQLLPPRKKPLLKEALEAIQSPLVTIALLALLAGLIFGTSLKNYFTGDDFTWLRWALSTRPDEIWLYFTQAAGFFYRPLAKLYFYEVSPFFGLRPYGYHLVSLLVHFGCAVAAYFVVQLTTKKNFVASFAAVLFLANSINAESVFWISTTSHLFASFFYLWAFVAYLKWRQLKTNWRWPFFILALVAFAAGLLSHERTLTFPLIILVYDWLFYWPGKTVKWTKKILLYLPFWLMFDVYFWLRNRVAEAHGLSGDYNYSWAKLPFNFVGNLLGYIGELLASFHFLSFYDMARGYLRSHKLAALILLLVGGIVIFKIVVKKIIKQRRQTETKWLIFASSWVVILLLPFLGLGNIAERYVYPAHLGIFMLLGLGLKALYHFLLPKIRQWAFLLVAGLSIGFLTFHTWEIDKARQDWFSAGEEANEILRVMATNYQVFPLSTHLYFVNLPIRYRRAWVFPVGLPDALWFIYRDDSLNIYQMVNPHEAFDHAEGQKEPAHVLIYVDGELRKGKREKD